MAANNIDYSSSYRDSLTRTEYAVYLCKIFIANVNWASGLNMFKTIKQVIVDVFNYEAKELD